MVIVQFVDNGAYDISENTKDENDYDHLLPPGEFEHLCTCTYGRVTPSNGAISSSGTGRSSDRHRTVSDSHDEHFTTVRM